MTKETEHRVRMLRISLGMENGGSAALIAAMTGGYITYDDTGDVSFRLKKKNEFEYEIVLNHRLKGDRKEAEKQTAMAMGVLFICYDFHYIAKTAERMMIIHSSLAKNSRKWHREKADRYLDLNAAGYEESLPLVRDFADALLDDRKQTEAL